MEYMCKNREDVIDYIIDNYSYLMEENDFLLLDGYDEAFLGIVDGIGLENPIPCYSMEKILSILMKNDGMEYFDALEFFDFNIKGSYVGKYTPCFL